MPTRSLKRANRIEIQWRVAPRHVDRSTLPVDRRWTHHSFAVAGWADATVTALTSGQSENGFFEFRAHS